MSIGVRHKKLCTTACISHCWQRVCVGQFTWLPRGNSTTKHPDHATAHTRGRWQTLKKDQILMKKRITYHWIKDSMYTFLWAFLASSILFVAIGFFLKSHDSTIKDILILSCIISGIIGARPLLSLFAIPDTLYLKDGKLWLSDGDSIDINDIKIVWIKSIGAGSRKFKYYEIEMTKLPTIFYLKNRKSIVAVERYNIKYIFKEYDGLIKTLVGLGLDSSKIVNSEVKIKHLLGFRDKFKN
jgi:hypothetical protein